MSYQWEATPMRQEVRFGGTSTVIYWPKAGGVNVELNAVPDDPEAPPVTGEEGTYTVFSPSNAVLQTGVPSYTTPVASGQTVLMAAVNASNTASYPLGEGYRIEWVFMFGGQTFRDVTYFDVVRLPFMSAISLNDLVNEVVDLERRLGRHGTQTGTTAAQVAARYGILAWGDVTSMVRSHTESRGVDFARLLVAPESLKRVTVAMAISRAYRADGGGAGSESSVLADEWEQRARARFAAMGNLPVDVNQDGAPDGKIGGWGVITARRAW